MREELGTPGAIVGSAILGLLFVGLTLAIYPGWAVVGAYLPQAPNWSDLIGAVSAIGTCAAVVVALGLAQAQTLRQRKDEQLKANLHSARISIRLRDAATSMDSATMLVGFRDETLSEKEAQLDLHKRFLRLAALDHFEPTVEELVALTPLPNNCAHRIARAYDIFGQFKRSVQDPDMARWFQFASGDARERVLNQWQAQVKDASELLLVASEECVRAAHLGAPPPSTDELLNVYVP